MYKSVILNTKITGTKTFLTEVILILMRIINWYIQLTE